MMRIEHRATAGIVAGSLVSGLLRLQRLPRILCVLLLLLLPLLVPIFTGCERAPSSAEPPAVVALRLRPSSLQDDRTYSVGRVQFRTIDAEDQVLSSEIVFIDRTTGFFDATVAVPAGSGHRLIVEALGSALLPGGGRTETGVALFGLSGPLQIVAGETIEVSVPLDPFIPHNLRVSREQDGNYLVWDIMPDAITHELRVLIYDAAHPSPSQPASSTLQAVPAGARVRLLPMPEWVTRVGVQLRSVGALAVSSFSDTLFTP